MPLMARFLLARISSSVAFQMLSVAVGWQIYRQTGSAFALGLTGLCLFLPMMILTLLVGHVADRFDRRLICMICLVIEAVAAVCLSVGVFADALPLPAIYLLIVIGGSARAFESPTMATLLPALVPREGLGRASAWYASSNQTAQILGPVVGGAVFAISGGASFAGSAALFLAATVLLGSLRLQRRPASRAPVTVASLLSGITFVRQRPVIFGVISLDLFAVLLGGATALLPIFADHVLHTGAWGLGMLRAAPAVGALCMSMVLVRRPLQGRVGHKLFFALVVFGCATIVFGLSQSIALSFAALVVLGAADAVSMVIRQTVVQLRTPDDMLGRVSAINMLFVGTSNQLGEFESGTTASWFGAVPAVVIGGLGTILVTILWMTWFPDLRRLGSLDGGHDDAPAASTPAAARGAPPSEHASDSPASRTGAAQAPSAHRDDSDGSDHDDARAA